MKRDVEDVFTYDINYEPIVLSKYLFDKVLTQKHPAEIIALYIFYYNAAKWQKTNQPKVTGSYVAKGLKWGLGKVKKYKRLLIDLGLIESIKRKSNGNRIDGHFVRVKFIWSADSSGSVFHPMENRTSNALSVNIKKIKGDENRPIDSTIDFLRLFPRSWYKQKSFRRAAKDFFLNRKQSGKRLTPIARKRLVKKLLTYPIDQVTEALNRSVENGWRGVFPESVKRSKATATNPAHQIHAVEIIKKHFKSSSKYWIRECYRPAVQLVGKENKHDVAQNICSLADWFESKQKRPIFKRVPKFSDPLYSTYSRWNNIIPDAAGLIAKYNEWLEEQKWLDNYSPAFWKRDNKVFLKFFNQHQRNVGFDFFNGRDFKY